MATERAQAPKRFTIGLGGGHREYNMNGITYVVSGKFTDPAKAKEVETLADRMEIIISDEFVDLDFDDSEEDIEVKPERSTVAKER